MRTLALSLLALGCVQTAVAEDASAPALVPFSASYLVRVDGKDSGESKIELKRIDDTHFSHRVYALGTKGLARLARFSTDQSAELESGAEGLRLTRADMNSRSLLRDRDLSVSFDWLNRQVHWTGDIDDNKPKVGALQGTPATGSSLNLQLGLAAQSLPVGSTLEYILHDRGNAKVLDYTIGQPETIEVPAGRFVATPVRGERKDKQRVTTAWYVDGLPPTPVRVLQVEKGEAKFELRLQKVES